MFKLEISDKKCETTVEGTRRECLAEMAIAFEALIETVAEAAGNGMTYEEAKKMLCDGADKVHEVKMKDESKD